MKLLITTQAVDANDPALGFFVEWIREFAAHAESVTVTALRVGAHDLPSNVCVVPLRPHGKTSRTATAFSFARIAYAYRHEYDAVFIHMNPEYAIIMGWFWKRLKKRVMLWYLHKSVPLVLRAALPFVDVIATASRESFRLATDKLRIVGHGIPASAFRPLREHADPDACVTAGRIAPSKGYEFMIRALAEAPNARLAAYGAIGRDEDALYPDDLRLYARTMHVGTRFSLRDAIPYAQLPDTLSEFSLFMHASRGTGSLDKAPLESMAAGVPVLSASGAFRDPLDAYGLYVEGDASEFAKRQMRFAELPAEKRQSIADELQEWVRKEHSLSALIPRLLGLLAG